jgi:hypothetical protein
MHNTQGSNWIREGVPRADARMRRLGVAGPRARGRNPPSRCRATDRESPRPETRRLGRRATREPAASRDRQRSWPEAVAPISRSPSRPESPWPKLTGDDSIAALTAAPTLAAYRVDGDDSGMRRSRAAGDDRVAATGRADGDDNGSRRDAKKRRVSVADIGPVTSLGRDGDGQRSSSPTGESDATVTGLGDGSRS